MSASPERADGGRSMAFYTTLTRLDSAEKCSLYVNEDHPTTKPKGNKAGTITAVINTNELLENILNQMTHLKDLVDLRTTSRQFRSLIDTSPTLQRKLFRRPDYSDPSIWSMESLSTGHLQAGQWPRDWLPITWLYHGDQMSNSATLCKLGSYWREMSLTQPPIRKMKIKHVNVQQWKKARSSTLSCESGITVGHVLDFLEGLPLFTRSTVCTNLPDQLCLPDCVRICGDEQEELVVVMRGRKS